MSPSEHSDSAPAEGVPHSGVISFIIPALNEEKHIVEALTAIRNLTRPSRVREIEIIVVDNRSTDRTAELARAWARIVEVPPQSPSHARNAGAARPPANGWRSSTPIAGCNRIGSSFARITCSKTHTLWPPRPR